MNELHLQEYRNIGLSPFPKDIRSKEEVIESYNKSIKPRKVQEALKETIIANIFES